MEQPGGRVYPLKSLGYENQQTRSYASFPPSGALLFVAVQCGSVRLYWRFHRAVRFGSLILAFPLPKVSRNKRAVSTYFSTVTLPSRLKGWRKRGVTLGVILKSLKKYPVWYDQVTDIFATQTARRIDLIYK